jgi:beta-glucanase (GH16 family)
MKKKYLLCVLWLYSGISLAQTTLTEDFEDQTFAMVWEGDNCIIDANFANPFQLSANLSEQVMRYHDQGAEYANVRYNHPTNFDLSGTHSFTFKLYVPTSGLTGNAPLQVSLKLQNGSQAEPWANQTEIIKPIVANQWQTVSFNFDSDTYINLNPNDLPPQERQDLNRILIQLNGEGNTDQVVAYIDDFEFTSTPAEEEPPLYTQLVWQDEFDGTGEIDNAKWHHQTLLPAGGSWYNGEIQHYTDRIENAEVSNGTLKITAKAEVFTDQGITKNHTSARLNSKFAFTYGRVKIRAKLPTGVGTWPALWLLGQNIDENGAYWDNQGFDTTPWPACGEIDIMEHWGSNQDYVSSALHTPSSFGGTVNYGGRMLPNASTAFHDYEMIWTPDYIEFRVDGVTHYTYEPEVKNSSTWPFDANQYLLLNVAILPSISPSFTESSLEIDYVRVYQAENLNTTTPELQANIKLYPNPVQSVLQIDSTEAYNSYRLYNTLGQLVRQGLLTEQRIDLEDLPKGVYVLQLNAPNAKTVIQRIIKA